MCCKRFLANQILHRNLLILGWKYDGNNTRDRVFCLSLSEAERYLKNDGERMCQPTVYARNQGAWVDSGNGCCYWWLRSLGYGLSALHVNSYGELNQYGTDVSRGNYVVRPALRLIWN